MVGKKWLFLVLLLFLPIVSASEQVSFDGFETGTFCGGIGWTDACWTTEGSTAMVGWNNPYEGNRHVWLRTSTGVLSRSVNTTGYGTVIVGFAYRVNSFEGGDTATFSIIVDGGAPIIIREWTPVDSDNQWHYVTYDVSEYVGESLTLDFRSHMSDFGDEIHFDNIEVIGEVGVASEVNLFMEQNYPVGMTNVPITMTSTETNTLHTVRLYDGSGVLFCEKNAMSPSVSETIFVANCDLPITPSVDARAEMFVTNDPTINNTRFFHIVDYVSNPDLLRINHVYYPEMILQGSNIEIFTTVQNLSSPISSARAFITYPNNQTRILSLYPTINQGEYRAFITDTFRTGNTTFRLQFIAGDNVVEYTNQYFVAPYTIDYVDTVDNVNRILEPKMSVFGTEYTTGENGTVFLQLLDGFGNLVNDGSCHLSIYYPDKTLWYDDVTMDFAGNGLYYEDFVTPSIYGIYMTSVFCMYDDFGARYDKPSSNVLLSPGGTFDKDTTGNPVEVEYSDCTMSMGKDTFYNEFRYNESTIGNINTSLLVGIDLTWIGQNEEDNCVLQAYDFVTASWDTIGTSFDESESADGDCKKSHGVNRDIISDFNNYISGDEFRWRVYCGGDDKRINTDNAKLVFHKSGGFINNIRGSNEIHISANTDNILSNLDDIKNDTSTILNNTLDIINISSSNNIILEQLIVDIVNLSIDIPVITIGGTEYTIGEEGLVAVRLSRIVGNNQQLVTGATCEATILYPNTTTFVNSVSMTEYGSGIYYYNFTVPSTLGVYIYSIDCEQGSKDYYAMNTFHVTDYMLSLEEIKVILLEMNMTLYQTRESILNDTNQLLINLNQINTSLTTLYAKTLYLEEMILDQHSFGKESVFLVTDSVVRAEKLMSTNDNTIIKEELQFIRNNIENINFQEEEVSFLESIINTKIFMFLSLGVFLSGLFFVIKRKVGGKKHENINDNVTRHDNAS